MYSIWDNVWEQFLTENFNSLEEAKAFKNEQTNPEDFSIALWVEYNEGEDYVHLDYANE